MFVPMAATADAAQVTAWQDLRHATIGALTLANDRWTSVPPSATYRLKRIAPRRGRRELGIERLTDRARHSPPAGCQSGAVPQQ